jgi:hypothetical protein
VDESDLTQNGVDGFSQRSTDAVFFLLKESTDANMWCIIFGVLLIFPRSVMVIQFI